MADKEVPMILGGPWGRDEAVQTARRRRRWKHGRRKNGDHRPRILSCRTSQRRRDSSHRTGVLGDCASLKDLTFGHMKLNNALFLLGQSNVETLGILPWYRRQLLPPVE